MTERERWIVYPLLFLALGAALRDKLVDRTTARSIVCQELLIVDEESTSPQSQRTLARFGRMKGKSTATLQINGDLEITNDDVNGVSQTAILAHLGRTDRPGAVHGELLVDIVNAKQYFWQNVPILTMQIAPGAIFPGILPAVPKPGPKVPSPNAPKAQLPSQPPASGLKKSTSTAPPPSPADKATPTAE
jgi:hypothetical protein